MTHKEVAQMVESIGLPFAYYQFPDNTAQKLPYICYFYTGSADLYADMTNYQRIERLSIELYTKNKDFTLEERVEKVLETNRITYAKECSYIDSEKMWQIAYEMEVLING